MPVSPRTVLRLLHAQPIAPNAQPRVIGIDDWAWKQGRNYGTMCVDVERQQPINMLPDRSPDSVAMWLQAQPSVEISARDRSGGYEDGVTCGAPHSTHVADRGHVLKNLGDTLEYFFHRHTALLKQAIQALNQMGQPVAMMGRAVPTLAGTTSHARTTVASANRHARAVARYAKVHALYRKRLMSRILLGRWVSVAKRCIAISS